MHACTVRDTLVLQRSERAAAQQRGHSGAARLGSSSQLARYYHILVSTPTQCIRIEACTSPLNISGHDMHIMTSELRRRKTEEPDAHRPNRLLVMQQPSKRLGTLPFTLRQQHRACPALERYHLCPALHNRRQELHSSTLLLSAKRPAAASIMQCSLSHRRQLPRSWLGRSQSWGAKSGRAPARHRRAGAAGC